MPHDVDYDKLPDHLRESLRLWIEGGYPPGHFLTACLSNNLSEAVGRADANNLSLIPNIVRWLYNEAPSACWGSPAKVRTWQDRFWPRERPGNRLDDGSNEAIADREDFDAHELNP